MKILVSGHFIFTGRIGGAEHMAYNLVRGMDDAGAELSLLCAKRENISNDFLEDSRRMGLPIVECGGPGPRFLAEQRACIENQMDADAILFPNYFVPPVIPKRLGRVSVVIHDFQYRHFPQHFSAKKRAWLRMTHAWAFHRADTVIMISEFVRQDALRLYGKSAARSIAIPNPISWDRFGSRRGPHPFGGRPYILSVAAQYPHKRLDVLIKAFAELAPRHPDLILVLTGQFAANLVSVAAQIRLPELIASLKLQNRVEMTGYVDDARLGDLYHHASVFAFPSVFEGFGMPAVEAMGFGLPTLTTRRTSLPEVTLGLANYVDRSDEIAEWADRLEDLLGAPRTPEIGRRIRDHYQPERIGRDYVRVMTG